MKTLTTCAWTCFFDCTNFLMGKHHYLPLKYFINFFLSTLREDGPCRLKLITCSKIFVHIYEVLGIAPISCLYCIIDRRAPLS